MVAERKGLADWYTRTQHAQARPPPSYHSEKGGREDPVLKSKLFSTLVYKESAKTHWQCDQQAKDNRQGLECQCDIG